MDTTSPATNADNGVLWTVSALAIVCGCISVMLGILDPADPWHSPRWLMGIVRWFACIPILVVCWAWLSDRRTSGRLILAAASLVLVAGVVYGVGRVHVDDYGAPDPDMMLKSAS